MRTILAAACISSVLLSVPVFAAPCDGFADVDSNSTFCSAVRYIKDKGITLGCTGSTYCPNDFVTRLQMAAFLQRAGKGGTHNTLGDYTTSVGGGDYNTVTAQYGTIAGGYLNTTTAEADYAVVSGGTSNVANDVYASVGGGTGNQALAQYSTVAGGYQNVVWGMESFIGGGESNSADGTFSVVVGGILNNSNSEASTVCGGADNRATGMYASVGGGFFNSASGDNSTVPGGANNTAAGGRSVALGYRAKTEATAFGSFVFGDNTEIDISTAIPNEFLVGASGGIRMLSNKDGSTGCSIVAGGGSWACTSSRDVKRDFSPIDTEDVLARALALPVMRWRYMHESPEIRHMGTFSQEFRAAFGLGSDDKSITLIDAEGVALAAIQGLNAKLDGQLQKKDARIAALEEAMAQMQKQIAMLTR